MTISKRYFNRNNRVLLRRNFWVDILLGRLPNTKIWRIMSSWAGTDDLNDALVKVSARNPPSASGVKAVVKVCSKYIKEYKHIVFFVKSSLECNNSERVPVLYAMDALLRHFKNVRSRRKKLCIVSINHHNLRDVRWRQCGR